MEKLKLASAQFKRALKTLEEILGEPESAIVRDASIQRFEYTFETVWKFLKRYLYEHEGVECNSPKSCFRQAFKNGLTDEAESEILLRMCDDRNLASHTYIEALSKLIYSRLPEYCKVMKKIGVVMEK